MMTGPFDYFVIFAEMRTGSNFLETNINAFAGLECYGEAFNPHFIGYPNKTEILGVDQDMRDKDPMHLLKTIRQMSPGLGGFRYFHDHDPRILQTMLDDPRCAKIILTRNPSDSYVSWKIAQATGQWKLTDVRRRKDSKVRFDAGEFRNHVGALQAFQLKLLNALQARGQTAFYVAYEDLQSVDVMNGLAKYLGVDARLDALDDKLKRQNPSPISQKVSNFEEMQSALADLDQFNLARTPNFEPRRGPIVPSYYAGNTLPLLYMPIRSGPEGPVVRWLAQMDGVAPEDLLSGMNQKNLRQWKRTRPGHRSFTVLRHPVARAHAAFCKRILSTQQGHFSRIRQTLRKVYKLPLPGRIPHEDYTVREHRAAFIAFLNFVKANLAGQTSIRMDANWATQSNAIQGFGEFNLPDMILRESDLPEYLPGLAAQVGRFDAVEPESDAPDAPYSLADIYDEEIEALAQDIYQRDYMMFGFRKWA